MTKHLLYALGHALGTVAAAFAFIGAVAGVVLLTGYLIFLPFPAAILIVVGFWIALLTAIFYVKGKP